MRKISLVKFFTPDVFFLIFSYSFDSCCGRFFLRVLTFATPIGWVMLGPFLVGLSLSCSRSHLAVIKLADQCVFTW